MSRLTRRAVEVQVERRARSLAKVAKKGAAEPLLEALARVDIALQEALVTVRQAKADSAPAAEVRGRLETLNKLQTRWQVLAFSAGILRDTVSRRRSRKDEEIAELKRIYYGVEGEDGDEA